VVGFESGKEMRESRVGDGVSFAGTEAVEEFGGEGGRERGVVCEGEEGFVDYLGGFVSARV
jgi:hypothetical protein